MKSKQQKRTEALTRNEAWASLSKTQKLAYLDANLFAALRQRTRLSKEK